MEDRVILQGRGALTVMWVITEVKVEERRRENERGAEWKTSTISLY
jgi:hypothetical protein